MFLPREWWKLSFLWFFNLRTRSPTARRALFRTSLWVSIASLALGVGALSVTLAVVTGFEWTLGKAIASAHGHLVHSLRRWESIEHLNEFVALAPPGVERAEFFWSTQGLVVSDSGGRGVLIEGRRVAPAESKPEEKPESKVVPNPAEKSSYTKVEIELGKPLAEYLKVSKGQSVRLLLPGVVKGSLEAVVTDTVSHGFYEVDSRFVLVNDESLRAVMQQRDPESFANRPGDAHGIRYFLDSTIFNPQQSEKLEKWTATYESAVREFDEDSDLHRFQTWKQQKSSIFQGIEHNKTELMLVLSLLTLVAALNVAATLVVLFLERDREIAVLQALGLSPNQVLQWVAIQGALLGLVSAGLGMGLGRIFGEIIVRMPFAKVPSDIYNLSVLPLKFAINEQLCVFGFGVLAAVVAALILGLRLSRISLVEVLGSRG